MENPPPEDRKDERIILHPFGFAPRGRHIEKTDKQMPSKEAPDIQDWSFITRMGIVMVLGGALLYAGSEYLKKAQKEAKEKNRAPLFINGGKKFHD